MYTKPPVVAGGAVGTGIASAQGDPVSTAAASALHGHLAEAARQLGALPRTGLSIMWLLVAGFTLVVCGLALISLTARPRRAVTASARLAMLAAGPLRSEGPGWPTVSGRWS
ncbi:MAG: hypothetical protein WCD35_16690 [Mycobacteriales bacterium]